MEYRLRQNMRGAKALAFSFVLLLAFASGLGAQAAPQPAIQFIFTSDPHYGITRKAFRGAEGVDARIVNAALVAQLNAVSGSSFADDGGLGAGKAIGPIDFIVEGGDIANREEGTKEKGIQASATSWAQFKAAYVDGLALKDRNGNASALYLVPGNHDATNAVGFYKPMFPATDATAMAEIYDMAMKPAIELTKESFDYERDKIHYSVDLGGIHFVFLSIWPDREERQWMEEDLKAVPAATPVLIFVHDEPEVEAKHFINPNPPYDVNPKDKFENLLSDKLADGATLKSPTRIEQRALEAFFRAHPNISAYFHGNDHWKHFSDWTGPDNSIVLHVFGVDSPMKGTVSADDETKLSFYVVTVDTTRRLMTVRDCLWNADPAKSGGKLAWGETVTVALYPRPAK